MICPKSWKCNSATRNVRHRYGMGMSYCESLFCREKPKSELTVIIREEGMVYFLAADMGEFAELCLKYTGFNDRKEDMVLIPALTRERQWKRFPVVCYYLSK